MSLGGYHWRITLRDGRTLDQYDDQGTEQSVDVARDEDVVYVELIPQTPHHVPILLEVQPGERWVKHWRRFAALGLDEQAEEIPPLDVLGLDVTDGLRLYIHADGSILVTSRKTV